MESRRANRIIVNLPAEIIAGDGRYAGTIENFSDDGLYLVTHPLKSENDLPVDSPVEVKFRLPTGDKMKLNCKVKWSYLTPPHGFTHSIGLEISDPPSEYTEALKTLQ